MALLPSSGVHVGPEQLIDAAAGHEDAGASALAGAVPGRARRRTRSITAGTPTPAVAVRIRTCEPNSNADKKPAKLGGMRCLGPRPGGRNRSSVW